MGDRTYSFDASLVLSDNSAAYTAAGFLQVGGADAVIDLGGNQGTSPKQQARIDAAAVIDITALNIATADEKYNLQILGCNDPGFASAVELLGELSFGKGTQRDGVNMSDTVAGRYELMFSNEQANVKYQYIKGRLTTAGTGPSVSIFAFVAVLPEP